jgi:hypothetical protein
MWFIISSEKIDKVSLLQENEEQIFIENVPEDLINNLSKYLYVNGAFVVDTNWVE